ncbi:MAG TPA: zinc ribbon domain-containing protein [Puia sp.]
MLLIYGKRTARIKTYLDHTHQCTSCNNFDLTAKVYKSYFHILFIPIFPTGDKTVGIRCNSCGAPFLSDALKKEYASKTKNPFYLYSGLILAFFGIVGIALSNTHDQKEKVQFVAQPKVGDVYRIREDSSHSSTYFFFRVVRINGDSVYVIHNHLEYSGFVSMLNRDDYFVANEEMLLTKKRLKEMLQKEEIDAVERDYGDDEGFKRIK